MRLFDKDKDKCPVCGGAPALIPDPEDMLLHTWEPALETQQRECPGCQTRVYPFEMVSVATDRTRRKFAKRHPLHRPSPDTYPWENSRRLKWATILVKRERRKLYKELSQCY